MKRIIIGGTNSGCGKTTVVCAVLSALKKRNIKTTAFKCGPDYIDPMFHRKVIGISSHNLDSFFCDRDTLLNLLGEYGRNSEISVIEGVMGFYDGKDGSAYSVSEITETPAVIVIDCKGMSDSIGAVMSGFLSYRPNRIAGFIFNRLPEKLIPLAKKLCNDLDTLYFGCLPKSSVTIESRHLGLVTADEISDLHQKLESLGTLAEKYIDLDKLLSIECSPLPYFTAPFVPHFPDAPTVAVSCDSAFCFIYQESIGLLKKMGCRIVFFSPIADKCVPEADGLFLCGGYPELYADKLSANKSMLESVKKCICGGMPTIAECGGFMYLHDSLADESGNIYNMVGVISGEVFPTSRLQRFGYITIKANDDNLLCRKGEIIKAHEFHYWDSTNCGNGFAAQKSDGRSWDCCHVSDTFFAGFPHINLCSDIRLAENFVRKCMEYGEGNE